MSDLPRISIITPSYNQAQFIEQTIRSVLEQGYPNLEYIVMDGGSTDGTLEILREYDGRLKWTSEPDQGQSHALNKGFSQATGEVLAFLNSDDLYTSGALLRVGKFFAVHPQASWLTGRCHNIDQNGAEIRKAVTLYKNLWLLTRSYHALLVLDYVAQPATFWRREVIETIGLFDESLHYAMDYDYSLRVGKRYRLWSIPEYLASFRIHATSKAGSSIHAQFEADLMISQQHAPTRVWPSLHWLHNQLIIRLYSSLFSLPHYEK